MKREKKRRRKGTLFIVLGLLLISGAVGLTLYNVWDAWRAGKESETILEELEEDMEKETDGTPAAPSMNRFTRETAPAMPLQTIDGYDYIGILEIPDQGIRLPVMNTWDYTRLKISPCRYSGSYFTDDLVICAHNYASHFSPIKWIGIGTDVYFITVDQVVYHYTVSNRETVQPTAIEEMIRNQNNAGEDGVNSQWDLTLFTCNTGGQTRCAVRCDRVP